MDKKDKKIKELEKQLAESKNTEVKEQMDRIEDKIDRMDEDPELRMAMDTANNIGTILKGIGNFMLKITDVIIQKREEKDKELAEKKEKK